MNGGSQEHAPANDALYRRARKALEAGNLETLKSLAAKTDTHPEMLYYLAGNGGAEVRRIVAENEATPIQADEILASDTLDDVRQAVALKVARLLPDLPAHARTDIGQKSLDILQQLASDELPKVRAIVSNAIKSAKHIPADIAASLARDMETTVSAPVLQYSPLLTDQDLREIISAGAASGALDAIAKRATVSDEVSHDLATTLDEQAIASLLANKGAQIREDTLDTLIDSAPQHASWHAPLSCRKELSAGAMKRISGFVASYLVTEMIERHALSEDAAEELLESARASINDTPETQDLTAQWHAQAHAHIENGTMNDDLVRDLVKDNHRGLLLHCLAAATQTDVGDISAIMRSRNAKLVTALAWKAGLTMRTAIILQRSVALVNAGDLVYAKDGFEYPHRETDMDWLLASHTSAEESA